jgi:hypothetical protein
MPTTAFITKFRDEFEDYLKKSEAARTPEFAIL